MNITTDSKNGNHKYEFLRRTNYKIGVFIVVLIVINLILNQNIPFEEYSLLKQDGSTLTVDEMRKMNIRNVAILVPFLGFVFGAILSFIPFKKMHYKRKYLRFSLLAILVLYILQFVSYYLSY